MESAESTWHQIVIYLKNTVLKSPTWLGKSVLPAS
jgi:hypothetical protein